MTKHFNRAPSAEERYISGLPNGKNWLPELCDMRTFRFEFSIGFSKGKRTCFGLGSFQYPLDCITRSAPRLVNDGNSKTTTYDDANRLTFVTGAASNATSFTYNSNRCPPKRWRR